MNVPDARVVPLRGGGGRSPLKSQVRQRKRFSRYFYESRTRFFYQVYGHFGLLMANIFWTLGYGISLLRPCYLHRLNRIYQLINGVIYGLIFVSL